MEHLGSGKESKRMINPQGSEGPLLQYVEFFIHEYVMVCDERNSAVWANINRPTYMPFYMVRWCTPLLT